MLRLTCAQSRNGVNGSTINWGKAVESFIMFCITLVIMVEIAKYLTVYFVESTTVKF
jgi:hypothetical protein